MDSADSKDGATGIQFEHFDVVKKEATDHHYLKKRSGKPFEDVNSFVSLNIMKEWRILKKSLPESIYVHVYETRIDLLRAVIIGSPRTPYHDGLFFFDISLPSDYPNQPPKVHYHSHGYRLNPNLYANGKVCLSLINTWNGSKIEKWSKNSTILQILVSIQGLVLNERPYFNEPGYEVGKNCNTPAWINASISYSQEAFILSCRTMAHIMQKPPKGFEAFVTQHFRERLVSIFAAIKAYENGCVLVGQFQTNGASSSGSVRHVSPRFKGQLAGVRGELERAFVKLTSVPNVDKAQESMNNSLWNRVFKRKEDQKTSPSTSKNGEKLKKDNTSIKPKPQEHVKKHKTGILGKLVSFVKWISE